MQNLLKNDTNKLIDKIETDRLRKRTYGHRRKVGGGIDWKFGMDMYTLLYLK